MAGVSGAEPGELSRAKLLQLKVERRARVLRHWIEKDKAGKRLFPHEFMYQVLKNGSLEEFYQIPLADSWMYAAAEKNLPIIVPGWEDSTMGHSQATAVLQRPSQTLSTLRESAEGLGEAGTLLARYHDASVRVGATGDAGALRRDASSRQLIRSPV